MKLTYLNNTFLPEENAYLHISDLAIQRGYGIFDFLRVIDNHPLFLEHYLNRFYASAKEMLLEVPYEREKLTAIILDLIERNNLPVSGVKIILTGGYSPDAYQMVKPNLIITQQALSLSTTSFPKAGIKVITHEFVREMPGVKTINYLTGIRMQQRVLEQQAADVLYHQRGIVSEFPRCNFFMITQDSVVVTPSENILHGITRKNVIELASKKFKVEQRNISVEEIKTAKEAFLTSTTKRILPITQIDSAIIGNGLPGSMTEILFNDLVTLEEQELKALTRK